jgi:hypothetical protein
MIPGPGPDHLTALATQAAKLSASAYALRSVGSLASGKIPINTDSTARIVGDSDSAGALLSSDEFFTRNNISARTLFKREIESE